MDLDDQVELSHLLLSERVCRVCGEEKNLIDGYYRTRKNTTLASSYSYECKECTVKRITKNRKKGVGFKEYNCNNALRSVRGDLHTLESMIQYLQHYE